MDKPFSSASERNKTPIGDLLKIVLIDKYQVFEIGSGTGQHAVYFAQSLPHITWQTSDLLRNHNGIERWLNEANLANALMPIEFDVSTHIITPNAYDVVFTANTFHIMSWLEVCLCIQKVGDSLKEKGLFIIYGPFNFNGEFTSQSNQIFDSSLKAQDTKMGIRHFESICEMCGKAELIFIKKYSMPANNFVLVFEKGSHR